MAGNKNDNIIIIIGSDRQLCAAAAIPPTSMERVVYLYVYL